MREHPALQAALAGHERVVPVFCFDDRLLHGRHESGPRTQFLLESLADLDASSARARLGAGDPARPTRARAFLAADIAHYDSNHDALGVDRTSRLSPHLHFGCVSAREAEERATGGPGPAAFRRQLCWRDFHHHVLLHFPRNAKSEFQKRYRSSIRWSYAEQRFATWCEGRTG